MIYASTEEEGKETFTNAEKAVEAMGLPEKVVLSTDETDMAIYNIIEFPAIVIDGQVVSEGKNLSVDEIISIISKA
ncbi:thioredoxin family protein [Anaeropeptidivorans aminofermentans]|jgi:hypothetical protein|uniref:thioredoxin family protein n=1 Tax=Anaeropeptidivorans aminofermentans TaxID=2934315 RepID=UPI002024903A|nr:thioredoxin family protein [Anaeropeptidivorans aminofermentans]